MRSVIVFLIFLSVSSLAGGQAKPAQQQPPSQPASPNQPAAQESDAAIQAEINQAANGTINWEKSSTAGVRADVQLIKKDQANGRPVIQYRLKITGAPHNKLYNLIAWPIMVPQPATIMEG